ncbi:IS4 family transposase [Paenibacillus sp. LHD-38]|uniref:IS4 family transposase n=1 Tax=Paenibacillus sp. LHD-38 TaxID=3072143 RepID=UPI00280EEAF3|nr:IS4 family transposase [Paenibacillus sp. LHD-38]MDQ8737985.1 IS4 family transposase [Paenibacillus sp. LHD-38]
MDKDTLFSSFGKWLAPICTKMFIDRVTETAQDKYVKKLTTLAYFKLILHAKLQGRDGLRDIADDVLCEELQKELGLKSISVAQICRKHNQVDPALLEQVFVSLVERIHSQSRLSAIRRDFKIIDSTTILLCLQKFKWAKFRKTKAGIKVHTRIAFVNEQDVYPDKVTITPAKDNDRTQMDALIDEESVTYVFERGYVDYAAYDRNCENDISFVMRLKKNAVIEPLHTYDLPQGSKVSLDEKVQIGTQQKRMKHPLRMIQTEDSEGNMLFLITNRFDLSADEIGEMYRSRWAIETFFKWMKQHIKPSTALVKTQ